MPWWVRKCAYEHCDNPVIAACAVCGNDFCEEHGYTQPYDGCRRCADDPTVPKPPNIVHWTNEPDWWRELEDERRKNALR